MAIRSIAAALVALGLLVAPPTVRAQTALEAAQSDVAAAQQTLAAALATQATAASSIPGYQSNWLDQQAVRQSISEIEGRQPPDPAALAAANAQLQGLVDSDRAAWQAHSNGQAAHQAATWGVEQAQAALQAAQSALAGLQGAPQSAPPSSSAAAPPEPPPGGTAGPASAPGSSQTATSQPPAATPSSPSTGSAPSGGPGDLASFLDAVLGGDGNESQRTDRPAVQQPASASRQPPGTAMQELGDWARVLREADDQLRAKAVEKEVIDRYMNDYYARRSEEEWKRRWEAERAEREARLRALEQQRINESMQRFYSNQLRNSGPQLAPPGQPQHVTTVTRTTPVPAQQTARPQTAAVPKPVGRPQKAAAAPPPRQPVRAGTNDNGYKQIYKENLARHQARQAAQQARQTGQQARQTAAPPPAGRGASLQAARQAAYGSRSQPRAVSAPPPQQRRR